MIVTRPFAGLAAETELIALREFVPSASAPLPTREGRRTLATVLPGAAAALTRQDGTILLGMQVQTHSGDLSRDLAQALRGRARPAVLGAAGRPADRGGDAVASRTSSRSTRRWTSPCTPTSPGGCGGRPRRAEVAVSLERANSAIMPTDADVPTASGAYWVDAGTKAHLRWVRPEDEAPLMAALARLRSTAGSGWATARYVGSFRAHGRLVPVWDLDRERTPSSGRRPPGRSPSGWRRRCRRRR